MNVNLLLKLQNLIFAHAEFAKFIYKLLDICSQSKRKKMLMHLQILMKIIISKSSFSVNSALHEFFPCLVVCLNLLNLFEF